MIKIVCVVHRPNLASKKELGARVLREILTKKSI